VYRDVAQRWGTALACSTSLQIEAKPLSRVSLGPKKTGVSGLHQLRSVGTVGSVTTGKVIADELAQLMGSADPYAQATVTAYEPLEAVYRHATELSGQLTEAVGTAWLPASPITTAASAR
jgi:hypothetical protein